MVDGNSGTDRQVLVERQYLKKLSFASPKAPDIFVADIGAEQYLNVRANNQAIDTDRVEVSLTLSVKAVARDETIFEVETVHGGVFVIRGYTAPERLEIVGRVCPELLFPFARTTIADTARKCGFPNVLVKMLDFKAMFEENIREQAMQTATNQSI